MRRPPPLADEFEEVVPPAERRRAERADDGLAARAVAEATIEAAAAARLGAPSYAFQRALLRRLLDPMPLPAPPLQVDLGL